MAKKSPQFTELPLKMVGSNLFGRYKKVSIEETFNMIMSDNWLVPLAGYLKRLDISADDTGRALFNSSKSNQLIAVIGSSVYRISSAFNLTLIGVIDTSIGDVFIAENDASQIAICDQIDIWIYDYANNTFRKATLPGSLPLDFKPGYIEFQNGYFIAPDLDSSQWRLSEINNGLSWPPDPQNIGSFQTKPDIPQACIRLPGRGNQLLVMGKTVTEAWTDVGAQLFPYQRSSSLNIDYGCINPSTIAVGDKFVVWVGVNEKSGPAILLTNGGEVQQISNDGINFKLAQIQQPERSFGFLFKQDGHLIYQVTFYGDNDNITYGYDFATQRFFTFTDENQDHHIAKRIAYFNSSYYFISFRDSSLYELNSKYETYDGALIPRIRVCPTLSLPDSSQFIVNNLTFHMEQGQPSEDKFNDASRVDISLSYDGGESFGKIFGVDLNPLASRKNKVTIWNMGLANEIIPQFRFWGSCRFVVGNGTMSIYQ